MAIYPRRSFRDLVEKRAVRDKVPAAKLMVDLAEEGFAAREASEAEKSNA